jgi:ABC-type multidrug transport system fused ATPase/permease subunit
MQTYRLYRRLAPLINTRWKFTGLAYFCTIVGLVCMLLQPLIFSYLIDHVLLQGEFQHLPRLLLLSLGLTVIGLLMTVVRSAMFRFLNIRHTLDLRNVLTVHLRKIPLHQIEKEGTGKFAALFGWDTYNVAHFVNHITVELFIQSFIMLFAVGAMFFTDWRLGVVAALSIPFMLGLPKLFRKPLERYVGDVRTHNEEIGAHLHESIDGSREIRTLQLEEWERQRNEKMYGELVKSSTKETLFRILSGQIGTLPISFIILLVYWAGSHQVASSTLSVGMFVASVTYLNNALNPIQVMNHYFGEIMKSEVAMQRLEAFLSTLTDSEDVADHAAAAREMKADVWAEKLDKAASPVPPPVMSFEQLHVSLDGSNILRDIHFSLKSGQMAAIVGRSGSGKSTLFRSVMGFMPIASGQINLDGIPLSQLSKDRLYSDVGMVFQEAFLFRGTLEENIRIGRLSATAEEVYEAACLANLKELVDSLPDGLQTKLDHRGFQLSGGQRQRVTIARMFLKKPKVLLLDEPTSALDRASESQVLTALRKLMEGQTTLIATHRLDTIATADIIYVMDGGSIVNCGTHEQLMNHSALYREIIHSANDSDHEKVPEPVAVEEGR